MGRMMKPGEFVRLWGDREDDALVAFPRAAVEGLDLPEHAKEFLWSAGLPRSAAPFLTFGPSREGGIPAVSDQWGLPDEFRRYRVIGSNGSGDPVALDEEQTGAVVYLNHDNRFQRVLMNSSVRQLAESLLAYRRMVDDTIAQKGPDAYLDAAVPAPARAELERSLREIDPAAMRSGCFWPDDLVGIDAECREACGARNASGARLSLLSEVKDAEGETPGADMNMWGGVSVALCIAPAAVLSLVLGVQNGYWFMLCAGLGVGPCAAMLTCFGKRSTLWHVPIWIPWIFFVLVYIASALPNDVGLEEKLLVGAVVVFIVIRVNVSRMTFRRELGFE